MRLSLGYSQQQVPEQRQSQEQRLSLGQRLELRQEQAQQFADNITDFFEQDCPDSPANLYDDVVTALSQVDTRDGVAEVIQGNMLNPSVKNRVLKNPTIFANGEYDQLLDVASGAFFDMTGGSFALENNMDARTTIQEFRKAVADPDALQTEIDELQKLMEYGKDKSLVGEGAYQELGEKQNALHAANALGPHITSLREVMRALLEYQGDKGRVFQKLFRDYIAFKYFAPVVSERLLSRFANRAMQVTKKAKPDSLTHATLNHIGEYTLACMGIIAPELFVRKTGEVDEKSYKDAKAILADNGIDLDRELEKYKLQAEGTFFYHRYATLDHRPSRLTEELIRQFITETVREDSETVLEALEYEDRLFPQIQQISTVSHDGTKEGRKNAHDAIRNVFIAQTGSQKFRELLREKIGGPWYDKLSIFMPKQSVK